MDGQDLGEFMHGRSKMIKTSIVCNACMRKNAAPWYLRLDILKISTSDINWIYPIEETAHFCGEKCLENWLMERKKERGDGII